MSSDPIALALGRVPSGIFILTAGTGDRATGMLASWVMQAGFEPPMITVAVKQGRYVGDWLAAGEPFVLNVVGDGQFDFLKHFGKGFEPNAPAFTDVDVRPCARGVPVLVDAIAHLECEPVSHVDSGDHRIFLARVVRGAASDAQPMIHVRKNGLSY
ncbi:MAG: flavin reductase [Planctomycetales bacterium]|nr:flavin reductase [Planctomycetales bacterium]